MLDIAKDALAQKSRVEIRSELYCVEGRTDDVVLGGWKRRKRQTGNSSRCRVWQARPSSHLIRYLPNRLCVNMYCFDVEGLDYSAT
jgi:hypothetical protein